MSAYKPSLPTANTTATLPPKPDSTSVKIPHNDKNLIYLDVDIHHRDNDPRLPQSKITNRDVESMVTEVLQNLDRQHATSYAAFHTCTFSQKQRRGNSPLDKYFTYTVTLQTTDPSAENSDVNDVIEILDTYFSGLNQGQLNTKDNVGRPYSNHEWAPFTNMQLSCVNNISHSSFGLLMGLSPPHSWSTPQGM